MIKSREDAVTAALSQLPDEVAGRFAQSPEQTLSTDLGLKVRQAEHLVETRHGGGVCDGESFLSDGVILYRPTGNRRENFTLAHELGHWLVDQVDEIYDWLGQQEHAEKLLETICDAVAQTLLVPTSAIDRVLAGGPVSAQRVLDLMNDSEASRPVCAIAVARRLPGAGAVAIIERETGLVKYSSVQTDPIEGWPSAIPWPGQSVPDGHPLSKVEDGSEFGRKTYWATPWGHREEYYLHAVGTGRWVVAVFADRDLWGVETVHFDAPREFVQRPEGEFRCCGELQRARGYPCPKCHRLFCPKCKGCLCDKRAVNETTCSACGLEKPKHLIEPSGICVDCA